MVLQTVPDGGTERATDLIARRTRTCSAIFRAGWRHPCSREPKGRENVGRDVDFASLDQHSGDDDPCLGHREPEGPARSLAFRYQDRPGLDDQWYDHLGRQAHSPRPAERCVTVCAPSVGLGRAMKLSDLPVTLDWPPTSLLTATPS